MKWVCFHNPNKWSKLADMNLLALLFIGILQSSSPDSPVSIRCELDTELPLEEIYVSVEERREVKATPQHKGKNGGTVIFTDLPEGDLHLLFYREAFLTGRVEVASAKRGELIRLKVRLVEGNAILLDDYRIRGVNGISSPKVGAAVSTSPPDAAFPPPPPRASPTAHSPSPAVTSSQTCPPTGEPVTLSGRVVRIIDNDSFEFLSGLRSYIVYLGSATRFQGSGARIQNRDLRQNQALTVKGTVAAGPEDDCSIGAKEIQPKP